MTIETLVRRAAPGLTTLAAIKAFEAVPLAARDIPATTHALLMRSAAAWPDLPAIIALADADGRIAAQVSYAELARLVVATANFFTAAGVGSGEAVACLLPNRIETHQVLWGAGAAGIACPINPFLHERQIAAIAGAAGVRLLVVEGAGAGDGMIDKVRTLAPLLPTLRGIAIVDPSPGEVASLAAALDLPVHDFNAEVAKQPGDRLVTGRRIAGSDIAAYYHTGGTTGTPKLAQHSQGNQAFMAWALTAGMALPPGETIFCGLPLFHVNAGIITGLNPFLHGHCVVLLTPSGFRNRAVIGNFWRLVERFRPYTFSAVPTIYGALADVPVGGADIGSLRYAISGAAPLPADTLARFEAQCGIEIAEGYGLTEGTCVSTGNPFTGEKRHGSVGLRMPYTGLRIAIRDGGGWQDCATGAAGSVLIGGPNIFQGYKGSSEAGADADGWFDTGDLGRLDADGYLWLTGRAKDLIIRGGHNIDPRAIEEALAAHPGVALAAAVGLPDARAGELPIAYVTLTDAGLTAAELLDHARAAIPERAAVPVAIEILAAMPLTAVGKIFKVPLREAAARRAVLAALAESGIEAEVATADRAGVGLCATLRLAPADHDAALAALAGLPLRIEINPAEGPEHG